MSGIPKNQQEVLAFAGKGEIEDGVLVMPKLWSLAKTGKYHWWQIKIGIAYMQDSEDPIGNEEDRIPVDQSDIEGGVLDEGAAGFYWTEFAQEGGKVQDATPVWVASGKNIGRNNETTPFTQAILNARTEYNKRVRKGNLEDKELLITHDENPTIDDLIGMEHRGEKPWRIFPMAVTDISKPNAEKHLVYPCDIQPKYDGALMIIVQHPDIPEQKLRGLDGKMHSLTIDAYSRGGESLEGQDHILIEAYELLRNYPGLHIVGEAYKEGFLLQDISGTTRRQTTRDEEHTLVLDLMVFDCFYIDNSGVGGMLWAERKALLQSVITPGAQDAQDVKYVKLVDTQEVANKSEMNTLYEGYIEDGMEGAVLRNLDAPYEVGLAKELRSKWTFKVKPRPDAEWPVVGYKSGAKGKAAAAVIWIFAENDEGVRERTGELLPLDERKPFSADYTGGMDMQMRRSIYHYLEESGDLESMYYGKLMTLTYFRLSKDGLPQQPKALRFRDIALQETLMKRAVEY
jgi:hypothetical protein